MGCGPSTIWLDFRGNPHCDPYSVILVSFIRRAAALDSAEVCAVPASYLRSGGNVIVAVCVCVCVCVCVSVCLCTNGNLAAILDFRHEVASAVIAWPRQKSSRFWWRGDSDSLVDSGSFSRILYH